MTSHLRVTIDDIDLVLNEDTSISIELKNPYLNDGIDTYTYPFDVPLEGNRELFGDLDNPDSDLRLSRIQGHPMSIYVDGVLFASGKVAVIDEQTITDHVSISMTSNKKQLKDLFGDLGLRDLQFPIDHQRDLKIGEMIGDIELHVDSEAQYTTAATFVQQPYGFGIVWTVGRYERIAQTSTGIIQPGALGFSTNKEYAVKDDLFAVPGGGEVLKGADGKPIVKQDYINTSVPYNNTIIQPDGSERRALYHNARICYTHHALDADGSSSDNVQIDDSKYGPYFMLEADRPQSGICIYLLYVLEVLFRKYDIAYSAALFNREEYREFNRLSFYTTHCKYDLVRKTLIDLPKIDGSKGEFRYANNFDANGVNKWLSDRGIKGKLRCDTTNNDDTNSGNSIVTTFFTDIYNYAPDDYYNENGEPNYVMLTSSVATGIVFGDRRTAREGVLVSKDEEYKFNYHKYQSGTYETTAKLNDCEIRGYSDDYKYCARVMEMIANAENLPEMSVSDFLDSLWASFGLRFHYDSERNVVEPYFIRDILSTDVVHELYGTDIEVRKVHENITGVRIKYNAEKDVLEQIEDVRKGVTDYDTRYDYLVELSPSIIEKDDYLSCQNGTITVGNMSLYVDRSTGNVFRIKISKDALSEGKAGKLQPSFFQVAQFKGILELADDYVNMSAEDVARDSDISDHIIELSSSFEPLIQNDLNAGRKDSSLLSPFIGEDMYNENANMGEISHVVDSTPAFVHVVNEVIETDERYDISSNDDGSSPLQSYDWGNAITIMRGGGADARISTFDQNYDLFQNEKWSMVSGKYAMDYDCISVYGEAYDYNGTLPGIGEDFKNGTYDGTYTQPEAENMIKRLCPGSNANLLSPWRKVSSEKMHQAGYRYFPEDDYATYYTSSFTIRDNDGVDKVFLFTPINDYGDVMTHNELLAYVNVLVARVRDFNRSVLSLDAEVDADLITNFHIGQHRIISYYKTVDESNFYAKVLSQLGNIYYGDDPTGEVNVPVPTDTNGNPLFFVEHNAKYGADQRMSLAIRSYHRNPETGQMMCDARVARRGLADKFFSEYIYFLLHRKKLSITTLCEIQYIINMQWRDKYSMAGHTGWVDSVSAKASVLKGLEKTDFIMYEL